jgi:glycosyltransferase involved in cell wall biosynthesis
MSSPLFSKDSVAADVAAASVGVVLTHYDCERFLADAVRSVLGQTYDDLALYVVDDASPTDAWIGALEEFAGDRRLVLLRARQNVGHYRLKNALIGCIAHPYIAFQDADDVSHRDRIRRSLRSMATLRAGIVGCSFRYVDECGKTLSTKRMPPVANPAMWAGKSFVCLHPSTLVKRAVLDRLGGFDGTARIAADTDFFLRARYVCRIANTFRVLYDKRVHPRSLTTRPDTGFGSEARDRYARDARLRERLRREAPTRERDRLLIAPSNDTRVELVPVDRRFR